MRISDWSSDVCSSDLPDNSRAGWEAYPVLPIDQNRMRPWVIRGSGDVRLSSDIKALLSNKREIIHIDGMDDTNGGQARSTVRECEKAVGGPLGQAMETERRVCRSEEHTYELQSIM